MSVVEFKEGRRFYGVWFAANETSDWLCSLFRDADSGPWKMVYRFRYYRDDKAHDSDDKKSFYEAEIPADKLDKAVALTLFVQKSLPGGTMADFVDMRGLDHRQQFEALCSRPWCHAKMMTPEAQA